MPKWNLFREIDFSDFNFFTKKIIFFLVKFILTPRMLEDGQEIIDFSDFNFTKKIIFFLVEF